MKFKLVENYKITRRAIQEYAYDAVEEVGNASLEEYIQWFRSEIINFDDEVKQAVKDFYIEAIDCGKIDMPKTMITSELTDYIESNADLIDKDIDQLVDNCPDHLKHELTLVLDNIDDSLNESLFDDANYWNSPYDNAVFKYINENPDLVDDIETLYQRCSKYLKPSLVKILDHADAVDSLSVKRAKYLLQTYDPLVLINVIRDKDSTFRGNNAFDALEYGVNHWEDLFSDTTLNESLNEESLTEGLYSDLRDISTLMHASGYTNIVMDKHTNKIVGDKANKTYLFEVIFDQVNSRLNDRFYVNYADSVNKDKEVHLQPVAPVGASVGKAGVGHKRSENRRHYIDKIFIWELKYLSDASDPTTWP